MANFTLTIPDAQVPRIQAALADSGVTPKQYLVNALIALVQTFEEGQARQQALAAVQPVQPITIV